MQDDILTLLADDVVPADHIELKDAERELQEANDAATASGQTTATERKQVEGAQRRANAKVALATLTASRPGSV